MNYQGYLIANNSTGLDKGLQPWLIPDDAQFTLFDGYVYLGVWQKRDGYSQYAYGQRGGAPYCESRMVHTVTVSANEVPDGIITAFTFTVAGSTKPLRRGGFRAIDRDASGTQIQIVQDNGLGGTRTGSNGTISTTINYTTTIATPQGVTFTAAPAVGHTIILSLDVHQGFPVMGVMNFFTQNNTREMIVADTTYVNRYNAATNRLDDISPAVLLTGDKFNFMSWVNYPDPNDNQRLLFVNFKDQVQQYDGTTVKPYPIYTTLGAPIPSGAFGTGDGTTGPYTFNTPGNTGIMAGSPSATITETVSAQTIEIDQFGIVSQDGTGVVDLLNGTITVTFTSPIAVGDPILIAYTPMENPIDTALHISNFKDHLFVEFTVEGTKEFGRRIRISGTGAFCDTFIPNSAAIGAGVIDIPSDTYLSSSDFNRDDRILFTESETWAAKYSQNDVVPFQFGRIDSSRGSQAPYGTITYLNRTNAESTLGMILTDGYSVARSDDKIPDYTYNEIDSQNFKLCFAGSVDIDRDHYLIHPSQGSDKSDRILVTNYEEDNYAVYRIPLSCMGEFILSEGVTWDDLLIYDTWDDMAAIYSNWNSFAFSKGAPVPIGGGHEGQIFRLNDVESEDYPVKIRNITIVDTLTIQVTTDFQNYQEGDFVAIEAAGGMSQINKKQGYISEVISEYVFNLRLDFVTTGFSAYTSGGLASKCIVFESKTKKFNPFANADKKVSCGWLYFYVSTSGTELTVNQDITGATTTNPCVLEIPGHGYQENQQIYVNGIVGMTELNGQYFYVTVIDKDFVSLQGIDATGYTDYVSGGFSSTPQAAILQVRCISNDTETSTLVNGYNPAPYQVNLSSGISENGIKKWYKLWINQTARFVQFEVVNNQSGAIIQIHAMMPGFAATGRLV